MYQDSPNFVAFQIVTVCVTVPVQELGLIHIIRAFTFRSRSSHGPVQYCLMHFSAGIHTGSAGQVSFQSRSGHDIVKRYFDRSQTGVTPFFLP